MATYLDRIGNEQFSGVRGYQLPVQDIANTVQTLTGYWREGVQQIQNKYQKALGLDVTTKESRDFLNTTLQDIDSKIKDVSSKDLSIQDNVTKANNLFNPIFNGRTDQSRKTIIDNDLTNFYKRQIQQAESYKTKNGGKEYSEDNLRDVQNAIVEFSQNGNWKNIEQFSNKRREYTPYYDYSSEYKNVMSQCKANSSSNDTENGYFIHTVYSESLTYEKSRDCLFSGLSSKARNQIELEGRVNYTLYHPDGSRNYDPLIQDYSKSLLEREKVANEALISTDAILSGKTKLNDGSKLSEEQKQFLNNKRASLESELKGIQDSRNNMLSEVTNNFDLISGSIYSNRLIGNTAANFSYEKYKISQKPNIPALALMKEDRADARALLRVKQDKQNETLEAQLQGKDISNIEKFQRTNTERKHGLQDILDQDKLYKEQIVTLNTELVERIKNYVRNTNPNDPILNINGFGPYFQTWFKDFYSHLDDNTFKKVLIDSYFNPAATIDLQRQNLEHLLETTDNIIRERNPELFEPSKESIVINLPLDPRSGSSVSSPIVIQKSNSSKLNEEREKILASDEAVTENVYTSPLLNSDKSPTKINLANVIGISPSRIQFTTFDGKGNVSGFIREPSDSEIEKGEREVSVSDIIKSVGGQEGIGRRLTINEDGSFTYNTPAYNVYDPTTLNETMKQVVNDASRLIQKSNLKSYDLTPISANNGDMYRMQIRKYPSGLEYVIQQSRKGTSEFKDVTSSKDKDVALNTLDNLRNTKFSD